MLTEKICTGCKQLKPLSEFTRDKMQKGGLKSKCRPCLTAQKRESRHRNPIPNRQACKRFREKHPEKVLQMCRDYRVANRERVRHNHRKWAQNNKEKTRSYARRYQLRKKYGLSLEEFSSREALQFGRCGICNEKISKGKLVVDHDHATGKVRGLLCHMCNLGIGHFKDSADRLLLAHLYLKERRCES